MNYDLRVRKEVRNFIKQLDKKTQRIIKNNIRKLERNPYPGKSRDDKEKLPVAGKKRFRLHIGRA